MNSRLLPPRIESPNYLCSGICAPALPSVLSNFGLG